MCKSVDHQISLYREVIPHLEEILRRVAAIAWLLEHGENACPVKAERLSFPMARGANVFASVLVGMEGFLHIEADAPEPRHFLHPDLVVEGAKSVAPESEHGRIDEEMGESLQRAVEAFDLQFIQRDTQEMFRRSFDPALN